MRVSGAGLEAARRRIANEPMVEIKIDIDAKKQKAALQKERDGFLTALFSICSQATADYGADVDFSNSHHWVVRIPERNAIKVSALFQTQKAVVVPPLTQETEQ